jgi:hypothetical protein
MWQGDLCFGPTRDGEATVQSLDDFPGWQGLPDVDDAGRWAVEAYLQTYGPATIHGIQYYLGAGLSAARKALRGWLDDMTDRLVTVDVEGDELLLFADDLDSVASTDVSTTIRLLPAADPWVMGPGTADRHIVPPINRQAVTRGANLVLADGRVAGTWTRKADTVTVAWFDAVESPDLNLLAEEVTRLAAVLDTPLDLTVAAQPS